MPTSIAATDWETLLRSYPPEQAARWRRWGEVRAELANLSRAQLAQTPVGGAYDQHPGELATAFAVAYRRSLARAEPAALTAQELAFLRAVVHDATADLAGCLDVDGVVAAVTLVHRLQLAELGALRQRALDRLVRELGASARRLRQALADWQW
jgi:hypothetical protein